MNQLKRKSIKVFIGISSVITSIILEQYLSMDYLIEYMVVGLLVLVGVVFIIDGVIELIDG